MALVAGACDEHVEHASAPAPAWTYEPSPPSWNHGEDKGRFGRSQPPQRARAGGVVGEMRVPLFRPTAWSVPGIGPARAIVYGYEGLKAAVELIDVEGGRLVWRETATCAAPVVGVTTDAAICGGPDGVRALGLDGKPRWKTDAAFVAITGERVVVNEAGAVVVLDAKTGERTATVKLPAPLAPEMIVAACDEDLFAVGTDDRLVRIATDGKPKWSALVGTLEKIDPCHASVLVTTETALVAISRDNGKVTGKVDGARGFWPARDDSDRIEVTTHAQVASYARDLAAAPEAVELPPLGELLDARGDRRLVRTAHHAVVLLDRHGVHSYFSLDTDSAVLGGNAVLAASRTGFAGETVRRLVLPERTRRVLRLPSRGRGVGVPAELRDLPAISDADLAKAIAKPDTGKHSIAHVAIDPREPAAIYTVALDDEQGALAVVASLDLASRTWRWQRAEGCGSGYPLGLALADDVVACVAQGTTGSVRASTRAGAAHWDIELERVDGIAGAGDTILVDDAARLVVLDAATGRVRGRLESDDGARMRAAIVPSGETTWLVTFEAGRIVARVPAAGMLAAWSLAVDGYVHRLSASGDGVLVELVDGDAFRVDLATAAVTAMPGIDVEWRANGELVTGLAVGGPIPGIPLPRPPAPPRPPVVKKPPSRDERNPDPPTLWVPFPAPPPLGDSWQLTFYDLGGGLRARNDYALPDHVVPSTVRGPAGSPLVVAYGPGLREVLVLDPRTGDPVRRVRLPEGANGHVFATIIEGTPVAGAMLAAPLRAVVF